MQYCGAGTGFSGDNSYLEELNPFSAISTLAPHLLNVDLELVKVIL